MTRALRRLLGGLALAVTIASCGETAPPSSTTAPSEPTFAPQDFVAEFDGEFLWMARVDGLGQAPHGVRVEWGRNTGGLVDSAASATFTTDYAPFSITPVEPRGLCIVGRTASTRLVELWTFEAEDDAGQPAPCLDGETWRTPRRSSVELIWQEPTSGPRGVPRTIVGTLGTKRALLVAFDRSGEIVHFDGATHAERLVASPSTHRALARPHDGFMRFDTPRGHVYFLLATVAPPSTPDPVVLLDTDRDGFPDEVLTPRPDEWDRDGWGALAPPCLPQE